MNEKSKLQWEELRENRKSAGAAFSLQFAVKALYRQKMLSGFFFPHNLRLNDIAFFLNDGHVDFIYIVEKGGLMYLMSRSFEFISDGYSEILQLFNRNPHIPGFLVSKPETDRNRCPLLGILDRNGRELIPCRYISIRPVIGRSATDYDPDVVGDISYCQSDLLFFSCRADGQTTVYAPDGTPVFSEISALLPAEEKTVYDYSFETVVYSKTAALQSFFINIPLPSAADDDGYPLFGRYRYEVTSQGSSFEIAFAGPDEDWFRDFEIDPDVPGSAELLQPKISRIEPYLPDRDDYAPDILRQRIIDFVQSLFDDPDVYSYIDPKEIDFTWMSIARIPENDPAVSGIFSRLCHLRTLNSVTDQ